MLLHNKYYAWNPYFGNQKCWSVQLEGNGEGVWKSVLFVHSWKCWHFWMARKLFCSHYYYKALHWEHLLLWPVVMPRPMSTSHGNVGKYCFFHNIMNCDTICTRKIDKCMCVLVIALISALPCLHYTWYFA